MRSYREALLLHTLIEIAGRSATADPGKERRVKMVVMAVRECTAGAFMATFGYNVGDAGFCMEV
jgi:hypothetical protein